MDNFNNVFKSLADKLKLPTFFKSNTLIFNNLFLLILAVVVLIALLLVIFLVPGKKKKAKKAVPAESRAAEETPVDGAEEAPEAAPELEALPVEEPAEDEVIAESPVTEEAPADVSDSTQEPASETQVTEVPVEAPVEEPAEAPAEEPVEAPSEHDAEATTPVSAEESKDAHSSPADEIVAAQEAPAEEKTAEEKPAEKKKTKEEKKPMADKPAAKKPVTDAPKNGGKYEIVKRNGYFYFLLKANNGQLLLESTGYTTEAGAKGGIDTFKKAVETGEFVTDPDKNGNYKFILRSSAYSQMLYHGESYSTRKSAESAIESVKNFALRAVVKRVEEDDVEDDNLIQLKPLEESEHKLGGKYEIEERNGLYHFVLIANNGQLLLDSTAFTTEAGAKAGIDTFKKAAESGVYWIDETKNGKFRFILRSGAQLRYFGEQYPTRQSAENSIQSVCAFAQKSVLKQQ